MTLDELMNQVLSILPDALFEEVDGEIVISTGLTSNADGTLSSVDEEEF